MCITFIAKTNETNQKYKFILLFNRDEFLNRETYPLGFHSGDINNKNFLFYPLDCISGGTFLCINVKTGNFGCLLNHNFKNIPYNPNAKLKRAEIAIDFCKLDTANFEEYFKFVDQNKMDYNGFNFLFGNMLQGDVFYYTNNSEEAKEIHQPLVVEGNLIGLCNAHLENENSVYFTKVDYGKKRLKEIIDYDYKDDVDFIEALFGLMEDDKKLVEKHHQIDLNDASKLCNPKLKNYFVSSLYVNDQIENINLEYGTRHTIVATLDFENKLKIYEHCDQILQGESNHSEIKNYFTLEKRKRENMNIYRFEL